MSLNESKIVAALQNGEETASNLARITGLNAASIRRTIQELRVQGFNSSFGPAFNLGK